MPAEFEPDEIGSLERARFERTLAVNLTAPLFLTQAFAAQAPDGRRCLDRQYRRPARAQADAALSLLHPEQERAAQRDHHAGAGAGAEAAGQCGGARPDAAEPAPDATRNSPPRRRPCRSSAGRRPEDIAAAVLYLAQARSVTGVTIAVDGGQHLAWRTADSDVAE